MARRPLEFRVDAAVEGAKASAKLAADITEFYDDAGEKLRELADALPEFVDMLERASAAGSDWVESEGADKRDAREVFLDELDALNSAFSAVSSVCDPEALAAYCTEHQAEWTKDDDEQTDEPPTYDDDEGDV